MEQGRILVTGATGFVGRALIRRLLAAGREVTAAARDPSRLPDHPRLRPVAIRAIGPDTDWAEALDGVVAVIHLAAHVHVAPEKAEAEAGLFEAVNHGGSVRLFDAAAVRGGRLFVFVSSITVLGAASPPGRPFDDDSPPDPRTPYARSKLAAEIALGERAAGTGTELVTLRPPLIAGSGVGGNLRSLLQLATLPVPLPFGRVANRRTLLSLSNLCSAIEAVLRAPTPGTFVLGDECPLSTAEIVTALRAGLGRRPGLLPVPPGVMATVARGLGLGGQAQRLLGDLEVRSNRFRELYGWEDEVETTETLRAAASFGRGPAPPSTL